MTAQVYVTEGHFKEKVSYHLIPFPPLKNNCIKSRKPRANALPSEVSFSREFKDYLEFSTYARHSL